MLLLSPGRLGPNPLIQRCVVLLGASLLVVWCCWGLAGVRSEVALQRSRARLMTIGGGDVALRDVPKAYEIRKGHFFSDPYYRGEVHWYPFVMPLLAAAVSGATRVPMPDAFFYLAVVLSSIHIAAAVGLLSALQRIWAIPLGAGALLLGWLVPGSGLYPGEAAQGGLCLLLAAMAVLHDKGVRGTVRPIHYLMWGCAVGVLGLWHGASFIVASLTSAVLVVWHSLLRARREGLRAALMCAGAAIAGVGLPMMLLLGPQLLRYGGLTVPRVAATWMDPRYAGHSSADALALPLLPKDVGLLLVVLFIVRSIAGPRLTLSRATRATPLLLAFAVSVVFGHLGFVAFDAANPKLASVAKALLPAPPHTFAALALVLLPILKCLGVVAVVELALAGLRRFRPAMYDSVQRADGLARVAASALALLFFVLLTAQGLAMPARHADSEAADFFVFAGNVSRTLGDEPVFFRYPGRFVQAGALKIPLLSVDEYANPYVQRERRRTLAALDAALASGDVQAADHWLSERGYHYLMEDPRAPDDLVIRRCGGSPVLAHAGYVLRRFEGCRP
jgi:hypothetical protein